MTKRLDLVRRDDWPERLAEALDAMAPRPFAWGRHDCTTAWADICQAMTDVDPMAEFRGQYADAAAAKEALERIGSNSLYHTMCAKFGAPVRPALARRGDPLLVEIQAMKVAGVRVAGGPALMTCIGTECIGPTRFGAQRLPVLDARHAWLIG